MTDPRVFIRPENAQRWFWSVQDASRTWFSDEVPYTSEAAATAALEVTLPTILRPKHIVRISVWPDGRGAYVQSSFERGLDGQLAWGPHVGSRVAGPGLTLGEFLCWLSLLVTTAVAGVICILLGGK